MGRTLAIKTLLENQAGYIRGQRAAGALAAEGIKWVGTGEWTVPPADDLSSELPAVVVTFAGWQGRGDKGRGSLAGTYRIRLNWLRLLGATEKKDFAVLSGISALADLYAQGAAFPLPGWTANLSQLTGLVPAEAYPVDIGPGDPFLVDDSEVEHYWADIEIIADNYAV